MEGDEVGREDDGAVEGELARGDDQAVDGDLGQEIDDFLDEVLVGGATPLLPTFLGEEWEPLAEAFVDLLDRFETILVLEVTRPDGAEFYVQFARDGQDLSAELVSNEFLGGMRLPADRISLLIDLGWNAPTEGSSPNFFRAFGEPNLVQLAWQILQTLHDVHGAEADDTWAVMPPELVDAEPTFSAEEDWPSVEPWEIDVVDQGTHPGEASTSTHASSSVVPPLPVPDERAFRALFQMPKAVTILGRSSSVTNSFVNSIIPVITPSVDEIRTALGILGMQDRVTCSYCGDPWTEWDHLRPIVIDQQPTGYISEIHNLVPACGKCNQSKGNKPWRTWMYGDAMKSPKSRGIADIDERAARLDAYEAWLPPTIVDFAKVVGAAEWQSYWQRWKELLTQMRAATEHAAIIRSIVAGRESPPLGEPSKMGPSDQTRRTHEGGWTVTGPEGTVGPVPKNRAVLETVRAVIATGKSPESLAPLLGLANFRPVDGTLTGDELWAAFADQHHRTDTHRRLWFVKHPIHDDGKTWLLANNVWGPRTHEVLKLLVTRGKGAVSVSTPSGGHVRAIDTGAGIRVLKPGSPIPPKQALPPRPTARDAEQVVPDTQLAWSEVDRMYLDGLRAQDPAWASLDSPTEGFGSRTLAVATALVERGWTVRPFTIDDLNDDNLSALGPAALVASQGQTRMTAFTDDYGQRDLTWARLRQRIGPFTASPAFDRALAEFCVHGPFERHVERRGDQAWVTVMVRLADLDTALLDITNVAAGLDESLRRAN